MKLQWMLLAAGLAGCGGEAMDEARPAPAREAVSADCAGVMPASLANPQSGQTGAHWTTQSDDGIGRVAFGAPRPDDPSQFDILWNLYPTDQGPAPAPIATLEGQIFPTACALSLESQPSGFTGMDCANFQKVLKTWDHNGRLLNSTSFGNDSVTAAVDPSGGTAVLHQYAIGSTWRMDYLRFDKFGNLTASVIPFIQGPSTSNHPVGPQVLSMGINLAGHVLAIMQDLQHGGVEGVWLERAGTSHPFFPTTISPVLFGGLVFLPDGTLAVKEDQGIGWHEVFADLARAPAPAPAWLQTAGHKFSTFFTVRGGRAIAIANPSVGIDLVSAGGNACGTLPFSVGDDNDWAVGRDGTLSLINAFGDQVSHWWPQLLK